MPALVMDAQWNLLQMNRGCQWLTATLMPWAANLPADMPINMLDVLAHPEGLTKHMTNLAEVGPALLGHVRDDASMQPAIADKVNAFAELLRSRLGTQSLHANARPKAPVLTTRFATEYGELAFFSMFTTFGTPQDITLASLRVEHMFAADDATRAVLSAQVK
jgi:hypothetical protein